MTESLKERMARIKAERAALDAQLEAPVEAVKEAVKEEAPAPAPVEEAPKQAAPAPTGVASGLSFAEKLAAKRAAAEATTPAKVADTPTAAAIPLPKGVAEPAVQNAPANAIDEQRYADISTRIHELAELSEDDLKNAMSNLKKSLMENPAACTLMMDEDIGLMVIALRRITHVTITEAKEAKPKAGKPKASKVALTAEQLEAAFDEL